MSAVQRYAPRGAIFAGTLRPDPNGPAVLFADVEEALRDHALLQWLLPVLDGPWDNALGNARTKALADGLLLGHRGIDLVRFAQRASPL